MTALIGAGAAAAALVVSAVLLVFRGPGTTVEDSHVHHAGGADHGRLERAGDKPGSAAPTGAPTAAPTAASAARDIGRARRSPAGADEPAARPRTTKEPEIGVTRTPATRSAISVAPQRPGSQR